MNEKPAAIYVCFLYLLMGENLSFLYVAIDPQHTAEYIYNITVWCSAYIKAKIGRKKDAGGPLLLVLSVPD